MPFTIGQRIQIIDQPECWAVVVEVRDFDMTVGTETDFGPLQWATEFYHWEAAEFDARGQRIPTNQEA
jgi:hypothetical protein